ncbi:MAG: methyltransferase domain-containing protein [Planctomycetes bacterium]|nr:methyltransferase domain-containing protein [Planctomycetota bacterium]
MARIEYLQFGCGLCAPESWLNFDASPIVRWRRLPLAEQLVRRFGPPFPPQVRYGDIVRGLPVVAASFRGVYCSHTLEHLALDDFRVAVRHTRRYLVPGGTFRCVVPDLERLARDYLALSVELPAHWFMQESCLGYSRRPRGLMGLLREWLGNSRHRWMWDERTLTRELSAAGFTRIRRAQFGDAVDPMFREVEDPARWEGCLGMECICP